jgi:hypothetical protein
MFGKKNKESKEVFVSLSHKSISIAYEEGGELITRGLEFDIQTDNDKLMQIWSGAVGKLLSQESFSPKLILLTNQVSFLIKNLKGIESEEERYAYVASQIDVPNGHFNMMQVKNSSYLVAENSAIEKILFVFKEYEIQSLHDVSTLNALYLVSKKSELYLNISLNSIDAISNGEIFQKRSLKNLFLNYLNRSSKKLNLDLDSTYRHIQKNFSDIKTYDELMHSTHNGAVDLKEFIDEMVAFIQSTLDYFNNYELLEDIESISLDGDILELNFMVEMLKDKLDFDGIVKVNEVLKVNNSKKNATTIASLSSIDNLKHSSITLDGLRYNDGKQEYIFVDNSLVSKKKLTKEQKKRVISFRRVIEIEENTKGSGTKYKKVDKSIWKMDGSELIELIKNKFDSSKDKNVDKNIEVNEERGKIIFLIVLALLFGFYQLFFYIMDIENKFKSKVQTYQLNVNSVSKKQEKLAEEDKIFVVSGINKILWTEKFITLSRNMPDAIWFSSIRLENLKKEIEGKKITSSRVILDGRCLPSSEGHIHTIATYMENLMNADSNFKKDFIDVSFGGAETAFDGFDRKLISFKLYLNFRRNINIEYLKKEIPPKDKSIVDNIASIQENNEKKIKMLDTIGKE